jgi:hypothetical protein
VTTQHEPVSFIAGDTWEIYATCLDEAGAPFDLDTAQIRWTLINRNSGKQLIRPADCNVVITDAAAGKCTIIVPGTVSTLVPGGVHQDALRITVNNIDSTLAIGPIAVQTDPFRVATFAVKVLAFESKDVMQATMN